MSGRYAPATLAAAMALAALSWAGPSQGQSHAPSPPMNPVTKEECERFRSDYKGYLDQLRIQADHCMQVGSGVPVSQWVETEVCSAIRIGYPPQCAELKSQWHCESARFGTLMLQCLRKLEQSDDTLSRKLLLDTAEGVPGTSATAALKMSNLLADQGKPSLSKAWAKAAGKALLTVNDLKKAATALGLKGTEIDRLPAITSLTLKATGHNSLSASLLDLAMKGIVATQRNALDHLLKQLKGFSDEIGRANEEAIKSAADSVRRSRRPPPKPSREASEPAEALQDYGVPQDEPYIPPGAGLPACSDWEYYRSCLSNCDGHPSGYSACAARCQENIEADMGPCTPG